ncbi:hypothetical protein BKI52_31250 [marine bacterium AO1-C]|nr:hypothetical protein BKI52_31250 [marine bacterium AO1-C]
MNNKTIISQVVFFVLYVVLQVFVAKYLDLFDVAFCFLYINFIFNIPHDTKREVLLLLGFVMGFVIDSFYNTWGIQSAACVFIAFVRPFIIKVLTPKNAGEENEIRDMGFLRFGLYALILTFLHHSIIFFIEVAHFKYFFNTIIKIFFSTIFTLVVIIIIQYLSPRKVTKNA